LFTNECVGGGVRVTRVVLHKKTQILEEWS